MPGGSGGPGSGTGLPARREQRKTKTKHCVKIYLVYTLYIPSIYLNKGKHIVYTWYIPDIYQIYTFIKLYSWNKYGINLLYTNIYKVYTWYTSMLVYTWYIPGICRLYDHISDIAGICHAKTLMGMFGTSHVHTLPGHIPGIYQYIPGICPGKVGM